MPLASSAFLPAPIVGSYLPELERFTVSQQLCVANGLSARDLVIPEGHWYRVISAEAVFIAGGTAGNRTFEFVVQDAQSQIVLDIFSPTLQTTGQTTTYAFGPNYQVETATVGLGSLYQQFTIPDLLWPFGYNLRMLHVAFGGDSWGTNPAPSYLIEDYIPVVPGESVRTAAIPVETPVLL